MAPPEPMWIDVHTHLNMLELSVSEALTLAQNNGVAKVITISTDPEDMDWVVAQSQAHPNRIYCTVGIHPQDAQLYSAEVDAKMRRYTALPYVVGIGETGLDYYHSNAEKPVQHAAFRAHLALAVEQNLPVEIHTREAEADTLAILKEFGGKVRGLLHCFTGTQWLADEGLALGLNISISGIVTFKNAESLRSVVRTVPLDRLHVETDAPFLAPTPHRGKKNHPAFMVHTAAEIARLKEVSVAELARQTTHNAGRLFPRLLRS